jgi:hypothetical protein
MAAATAPTKHVARRQLDMVAAPCQADGLQDLALTRPVLSQRMRRSGRLMGCVHYRFHGRSPRARLAGHARSVPRLAHSRIERCHLATIAWSPRPPRASAKASPAAPPSASTSPEGPHDRVHRVRGSPRSPIFGGQRGLRGPAEPAGWTRVAPICLWRCWWTAPWKRCSPLSRATFSSRATPAMTTRAERGTSPRSGGPGVKRDAGPRRLRRRAA